MKKRFFAKKEFIRLTLHPGTVLEVDFEDSEECFEISSSEKDCSVKVVLTSGFELDRALENSLDPDNEPDFKVIFQGPRQFINATMPEIECGE